MTRGRGSTGRRRGWLWAALAAVLVGRALFLRTRARALTVVPPSGREPGAGSGWSWLTAPGAGIDAGVAADVAAHAEVGGLDVVDVVPADLATDDALELLRSVDPSTYRGDRLARGVSARQAIAARPEALERARLTAAGDLDPVALDRAAVALKHVAAWTSDLGVAPGLHAPPTDPDRRLGYLRHRFGGATAVALASGFAGYALLAVGLVVAPVAGLAALAAWCLQPLIALVGTPLHPPDLLRRSALRWILGPVDLLRTARGTWRPAPDPRVPERDSLRAGYAESLADGTDRFFEARRTDCPVCGSSRLVTRLTTVDLVQHKPGRFEIDRCEACGHLFQNPQLTVEGLEFYYRDVYDGLGEERGEFMFRSTPAAYRSRAAMLPPEARPGRWLDVGTGHGHFPLVAAEQWPDTVFEGLDISESIEEADRRGWVSEGYRGLLLDRAPELAGRYDVVSMFHYLEHTRDPVAELDAVTGLLTDGGYLLIELPDPDAAYADLVGPYWFSWLQPQHLHFLNRARLCTLLEARGYEIVSSGPAGSYPISELTAAWWLLMNRIGPETGLPWRPPPTGVDYARRIGVLALGSPVLLLAEGAGRLLSMVVPSFGNLNVFQVVARKP